ncbi:hypothetical protein OUHCRE14_23240 [Enterobacter hormaechei subsp. hoffmannii]
MRVRCTDIKFASAGDQDVGLLSQAIAQLFACLRSLDITWYLYVVVLSFVGAR